MITYDEFLELGGDKEIPQEHFNVDKYKELIDYYTFYKIDYENIELVKKVKKCLVELIQLGHIYDTKIAETSNIKSETVGSHRVDYGNSDVTKLEQDKELKEYRTVKKYFSLSGLMYRGV